MANNQTKSNEGRGGRRPGAGRPAGAATKKTRAIADAAASEGITPLEFMLQVMRQDPTHDDPKIQAQRELLQFEAAKAAAPYVHPKLASIQHTGEGGGAMVFEQIVRTVVDPQQGGA